MKLNLAVIFGSKSVEHEVSIITGLQIIENVDREKYNVVPIYIDKQGRWHTGQALLDVKNYKDFQRLLQKISPVSLRSNNLVSPRLLSRPTHIDVVIPALHGTFGEDGSVQGLLEMANLPYVGAGVTGSAIGMDKIMQKDVLKANGLPVVDYVWFTRENLPKKSPLKYPVFVKPANLGSSIAISKATTDREFQPAVDLAAFYDRRIIVEQGLENIIEINCSVLGYKDLEASVCEQPISTGAVLSYEDKYLRGGKGSGMASLSRRIPAPISPSLAGKIQDAAKKVFQVLDCAGLARIDFLVNPKTEKFHICEINTLPGSFSFYLWEKSGYPFPKLIDKLVELAMERHIDRQQTNYSISTNLLQSFGKGAKSAKS